MLVDAHCHVDLYPSYASIVHDARSANVRVLAVTTTPRSFTGNLERAKGAPLISVALGMHPQIVGTAHADMALFERLLPKADFIGEVGLDGSPQYYKTLSQQEAVLSEILRLSATANGRPMSVHGVRAFKRVLATIGEHDPRGVNRYALHWFSGTIAEARTGVELKCYFSVNEAMIASQRGREIIAAVPLDAVLTETDGPFIKRHDAPIRPSMVLGVTEYLARLWGVTVQHAAGQIRDNFDAFAASAHSVAGGTDR